MIKQEILLSKLIYQFYKLNQISNIDKLIEKLKKKGRINLIKKSLPILKDLYDQENNMFRGELETAFEFRNLKILENFLGNKVIIEKQKVNPELILGAIFRTKTLEIDFSFKNLFKTWRI